MRLCLLIISIACLLACQDKAGSSDNSGQALNSAPHSSQPEQLSKKNNTFIKRGAQAIEQLKIATKQLNEASAVFLETPDKPQLNQLRQQWISTHNVWHQAEVYFELVNQHSALFPSLNATLFNLHYPLDQPGFLDSIDGYPFSGLVNDIAININEKTLRQQHGLYDREDVAIGLHAAEFLIWGETGKRSKTDYLPATQAKENLKLEQLPNNRRRVYLALLTQLLIADAEQLEKQWPFVKERLLGLPPETRQSLIFRCAEKTLSKIPSGEENTNHAAYSLDISWQQVVAEQLTPWLKQSKNTDNNQQ